MAIAALTTELLYNHLMDLSELAQQQRQDRLRAEVRRIQRDLLPTQTGWVRSVGDRPRVLLAGGNEIAAQSLGGTLRLGQMVVVQSDGLSYWLRGAESV